MQNFATFPRILVILNMSEKTEQGLEIQKIKIKNSNTKLYEKKLKSCNLKWICTALFPTSHIFVRPSLYLLKTQELKDSSVLLRFNNIYICELSTICDDKGDKEKEKKSTQDNKTAINWRFVWKTDGFKFWQRKKTWTNGGSVWRWWPSAGPALCPELGRLCGSPPPPPEKGWREKPLRPEETAALACLQHKNNERQVTATLKQTSSKCRKSLV